MDAGGIFIGLSFVGGIGIITVVMILQVKKYRWLKQHGTQIVAQVISIREYVDYSRINEDIS